MENINDAKILLADDEPDIVNLLETVLRKEGFSKILKADTGGSAIEICKEQAPDLVVLDIMLPDMDGHEVCKKMREFSMIPIIFLSARSEEIDRLLSFALGGDDYITKPFSPREVVYRITAILKREQYHVKQCRSTVKIDGLEICEEEGRVQKNGQELQLTAMEFKLLIYMVNNKNVILSKTKIIEKVWGSEYDGYDNTLMVHIRHLREKIEDDPANPRYILTIKKMGYKFAG
ncbi:MAG: response regulator transcription factor [Clostridiaceae bacterium]|nr:response regulator transcription factor [Clostridiaceae bacterium]